MRTWYVLLGLAVAELLGSIAAAAPPNVVLIIGDDMGWTDYGFMGQAEIRTPHLDKLASQGAVFSRGYVPTSLCRASLASILTGLYPQQHKITCNDPPRGTDRAPMLRHIAAVPTLPRLLGGAGYISLQTGKWWEGSYQQGGFTHGMTHGDVQRGGRHGDEGLRIGRQGLQPIFEFIEGRQGKPFFIWYAPMLPHTPHNPPQRLLAKYQSAGRSPFVARYYAMCEWFDETCGQLLDYLDRQGLADNTLVIYLHDNGWIQDPDKNGFAPRSKRSPYDGGLRTPIVLRWPGKIASRRDDTTLVSSIDLAPTILAACGAKLPPDMPGLNLLEVCTGKAPQRQSVFGAIFTHDAVDIDRPESSLLYRWCVSGNYKLILPVAAAEPVELYDVSADFEERKNLADKLPVQVETLSREIRSWWNP
jgi:uncharacterized sulfatase